MLSEFAKSQKAHGVTWTDRERAESKLAFDLAALDRGMIGYEEAKVAFERSAVNTLKSPTEMDESDYPF